MGKIIDIKEAQKKQLKPAPSAPPVKLPQSDSQQPIQQTELNYLAELDQLVSIANQLGEMYNLAPKDILTDSLCLLIEQAILEECEKSPCG